MPPFRETRWWWWWWWCVGPGQTSSPVKFLNKWIDAPRLTQIDVGPINRGFKPFSGWYGGDRSPTHHSTYNNNASLRTSTGFFFPLSAAPFFAHSAVDGLVYM